VWVPETERPPALLISPHLDDAVLSCGRFMAIRPGCTVLTALAGSPAEWTAVTGWDSACGFSSGEDVIAARLSEDATALVILRGRQLPVGGLDFQYGPQPERAKIIREGIESAVADLMPKTCVIPLGLLHPDHEEVRRIATLVAASDHAPVDWIVYEELPYGPDDVLGEHHRAAFDAYHAAGFQLTEIAPELGELDVKSGAVEGYKSQLRALRQDPDFDEKIVAERYWSLSLNRLGRGPEAAPRW
jgi:LmbE family N-acetylglucosaminyl deacetylase